MQSYGQHPMQDNGRMFIPPMLQDEIDPMQKQSHMQPPQQHPMQPQQLPMQPQQLPMQPQQPPMQPPMQPQQHTMQPPMQPQQVAQHQVQVNNQYSQEQPLVQGIISEPIRENFSSFISNISELNDTSLKSITEPTITLFYSPQCGHCVHLKPIYEQANEICKRDNVNVSFTSINGAKYNSVIGQYNIIGYPTLILFSKGQQFMYKGRRVSSDIVDWIKSNL
jgi:thiol-disulfide isomerase/thioredoxin